MPVQRNRGLVPPTQPGEVVPEHVARRAHLQIIAWRTSLKILFSTDAAPVTRCARLTPYPSPPPPRLSASWKYESRNSRCSDLLTLTWARSVQSLSTRRILWIRRVESDWTERYHVSVSESLHLEFRDSYFHDAESRGDGGEGYGVSLAHLVTGALVENNIFSDVRHAMILQMGATGNVFGYNFARRNYSDDGWDKTAIALHGHYPSANLFEANTVGWAGADMVWGPNGPENTFFRNRIVGTNRNADFGAYRGIWMQGWRGRQYLVCNEINTIGAARVSEDGVYIPSSADGDPADVIQHANVIRGVLTLNPEWSAILPASYYLAAKPAFFGMVSWPALGCDQPFGQGKIPAQLRWESGEYIPDADPFGIALTGIPQDGAALMVWTAEGAAPEGLYWRLSILRDGELMPVVMDSMPAGDHGPPHRGLSQWKRVHRHARGRGGCGRGGDSFRPGDAGGSLGLSCRLCRSRSGSCLVAFPLLRRYSSGLCPARRAPGCGFADGSCAGPGLLCRPNLSGGR